jgi:DNA processing protein
MSGCEEGACASCMRRGWLLAALSAPLDRCARDRGRLLALLELTDEALIAAVAGRRRQELTERYEELAERYAAFAPTRRSGPDAPGRSSRDGHDTHTVCRHRRGWPRLLCAPWAPHMLQATAAPGRLRALTGGPVVAIVGSRRASDYGMEMARSLARGLAASGVTVTSGLTDGIALAAHTGALEAGGATVAVAGGGLSTCAAAHRALLERIAREGCAVAELARECHGRRWGQVAGERTVVGLATLTVVVEARETAEELAPAQLARSFGRALAAIPGRVTSPLSCGTNALVREGAELVRGAQDAIELLYELGAQPRRRARAAEALEARLQRALDMVGAGNDTPQKLVEMGIDEADALLALSELEVGGLLSRGAGGRYTPRQPSSRCGNHKHVDCSKPIV